MTEHLETELLCGTQARFLHQHPWVHPLNKRTLYVMDNRHGQWGDSVAGSPPVDDVPAVRSSKIKSLNLGAMLRSLTHAA